jgi:hypothetical protein
MMQERSIRPHQSIKPKIRVSAGGKATITSLPIITSRDYRYSLSDLRTWLVYLQKITEHNEPFMTALIKATTYITVHYRNSTHVLSRCMDSTQPQTPSIWMECILASHNRHAECTRITNVETSQPMTCSSWIEHVILHMTSYGKHTYKTRKRSDEKLGSVEQITPSTLAILVMRHNTHIKHVALLVWLCKKVSLT